MATESILLTSSISQTRSRRLQQHVWNSVKHLRGDGGIRFAESTFPDMDIGEEFVGI